MTDTTSFFIKDTTLSEREKVLLRHTKLDGLKPGLAKTLNVFPFDPEVIGVRNCENLVGSVAIPLGIAGPVRVQLTEQRNTVDTDTTAEMSLNFPLATTEGALVASVNRGARVLSESVVDVFVEKVGMSRAPVFECGSFSVAQKFATWLHVQTSLKEFAQKTSNHLTFLSVQTWIRGKQVYARCVFDTSEAMGMNMVSIALEAWWLEVSNQWPEVTMVTLSSNVCTDKKDAVINRLFGRGYSVHVEAILSANVLQKILRVSAADLVKTHIAKNLVGTSLAGSFSQNMQVANVVAAFFIATGQDPAHVVDVSGATVTFEAMGEDVYVAIDMPTLPLGVVGGGTSLPQQSAARSCVCVGEVTSTHLAAAVATASLCAEVSGLAALTEQTLGKAHKKYARG